MRDLWPVPAFTACVLGASGVLHLTGDGRPVLAVVFFLGALVGATHVVLLLRRKE